jgi:hypothetical protein
MSAAPKASAGKCCLSPRAQEIIARCFKIIGPATEERSRCFNQIIDSIDLITSPPEMAADEMKAIADKFRRLQAEAAASLGSDKFRRLQAEAAADFEGHDLADELDRLADEMATKHKRLDLIYQAAEWSADARRFARIMNSAAMLMRDRPLLFTDIAGEGQGAEEEWNRVRDYLAARASAAQRVAKKFKMQTRPPDYLKMTSAMCAFELLEKFSAKRPTLTLTKDEKSGAYYRLASVLYEAVTEVQDANMERQCRSIFHRLTGARSG